MDFLVGFTLLLFLDLISTYSLAAPSILPDENVTLSPRHTLYQDLRRRVENPRGTVCQNIYSVLSSIPAFSPSVDPNKTVLNSLLQQSGTWQPEAACSMGITYQLNLEYTAEILYCCVEEPCGNFIDSNGYCIAIDKTCPTGVSMVYVLILLYLPLCSSACLKIIADGRREPKRSRNNCQRVQSTNCCVTKLVDTNEKSVGPQTHSFLTTPDNSEEFLFVSSIDDENFPETLPLPHSINNEEYLSLFENHEDIFSNPVDAFTLSPLDTLVASTGDNTPSFLPNEQDWNEEAGFFSTGGDNWSSLQGWLWFTEDTGLINGRLRSPLDPWPHLYCWSTSMGLWEHRFGLTFSLPAQLGGSCDSYMMKFRRNILEMKRLVIIKGNRCSTWTICKMWNSLLFMITYGHELVPFYPTVLSGEQQKLFNHWKSQF